MTAGHTNMYLCGVCVEDVHEASELSLECKNCRVRYHDECASLYTDNAISLPDNSDTWHCDKCTH